MTLQTQNLAMVGLGIKDDTPPNEVQPKLENGIHLRWAFKRELGFPWYGFYLLRRKHLDGLPIGLMSLLVNSLETSQLLGDELITDYGQVSSDRPLILTTAPSVGFDLDNRQYLRWKLPARELSRQVSVGLEFRDTAQVEITALWGEIPVAITSLEGQAGQVEYITLEFDGITAIELRQGAATLIGMWSTPIWQDAALDWEIVPGFPAPMALPVIHPDYPCSQGNVDLTVSKSIALERVLYGDRSYWYEWADRREAGNENFTQLHQQLIALVEGGPSSSPMAQRKRLVPDASGSSDPKMPEQQPLDLVLLASLHPAIAQMLGLYWVDQQAEPRVAYDYLIVGDYDGRFGGEISKVYSWLREGQNPFDQVDGYIVFNKKVESAPALAAPGNLKVYALPGTTIEDFADAQNNAGLRWDLGVAVARGMLLPGKAIMYHLWRSSLGNEESPASPDRYDLITQDQPVMVTGVPLAANLTPQRPPDWPPFPLHAIDRGLKDGWYSYQVSGIDIFGRHSPNSQASQWLQWTPEPEPRSWYYQEPSDRQVHPFAVRLLDKIAPPPPAAITAHALDPIDRMVVQDNAYKTWRSSNPGVVGLRISWLWTQAHMRQAPDTREFRIYYHPGQMNAVLGNTQALQLVSNTETEVKTDIPNSQPANAWVGALLKTGEHTFRVSASYEGSPLQVRVRHEFTTTEGTVAVENGSSLVTGRDVNWGEALLGLTLKVAGEETEYTILQVGLSNQLRLDREYAGSTGSGKRYTIAGKLPRSNAPCSISLPPPYGAGLVSVENGSATVRGTNTGWNSNLAGFRFKAGGGETEYRIAWVISSTELSLEFPYTGISSTTNYSIQHPLWIDYSQPEVWQQRIQVVDYNENVTEIVQPVVTREGQVLQGEIATIAGNTVSLQIDAANNSSPQLPDLSEVQIGNEALFVPYLFLEGARNSSTKIYRITAVDDVAKTVTVESTPDSGGAASRWTIGPLARRYEVFLPANTDSFTPTLAEPVVYAHIGVSAVDDKAHTLDRRGDPNRVGNESSVGSQVTIFRVKRDRPPHPEVPSFVEPLFATAADYHGHSFFTYRWLPARPSDHLKTHIYRALDDSLFKTDWAKRKQNSQVLQWSEGIPEDWDAAKREQAIAELNELVTRLRSLATDASTDGAIAFYRRLSDQALRVLASLPSNEEAFTQLTIQPLDPEELEPDGSGLPRWRDRVGPDTDASYVPQSTLRAYVDTLDGRSTNRYFYRAAYVDGAQNRSAFSSSSPPVYLPNVVPPRAPVITKIFAGDADPNAPGDRKITLCWASNREPDLAEYRIYRTDNEAAARDIRLMTLVHTMIVQPPADVPEMRSAEVVWTDNELIGGSHYYYQIVAVDEAGNVSDASGVFSTVAVDTRIPEPPIWSIPVWVMLRDGDGGEEAWPTNGIAEAGRQPALHLEWTGDFSGATYMLQRRARDELVWRVIGREDNYREIRTMQFLFYDRDVSPRQNYTYRIRVTSPAGISSIDFREIETARPSLG